MYNYVYTNRKHVNSGMTSQYSRIKLKLKIEKLNQGTHKTQETSPRVSGGIGTGRHVTAPCCGCWPAAVCGRTVPIPVLSPSHLRWRAARSGTRPCRCWRPGGWRPRRTGTRRWPAAGASGSAGRRPPRSSSADPAARTESRAPAHTRSDRAASPAAHRPRPAHTHTAPL